MYRKQFIDIYLKNNFDFEEAKSEIDFALEILFNYKYKDFLIGKKLENWQRDKFKKIVEERTSTRRPIQQIIGQAYFYGKNFFVNEYTLIPRPETELLVNEALTLIKEIINPTILDIGTGSGCIPITIALEHSTAMIDSVDISQEALNIAAKNKLFHQIFNRINFIKSDLFENINNKYDLIVSNPPYIPLKDKNTLQIEVKNFEPANALFTNDELGVSFYKDIIDNAKNYLKDNGFILFEIGINQSDLIKKYLADKYFKNIKVIKDFNNIERIISAQI